MMLSYLMQTCVSGTPMSRGARSERSERRARRDCKLQDGMATASPPLGGARGGVIHSRLAAGAPGGLEQLKSTISVILRLSGVTIFQLISSIILLYQTCGCLFDVI